MASWGNDAEILWIKFKLGTFMPDLPARNFMDVETALPLPEEPTELRANVRALLDDAPEEGLHALADGGWLTPLLWEEWGAQLEPRGWRRAEFQQVVAAYSNELRLWITP